MESFRLPRNLVEAVALSGDERFWTWLRSVESVVSRFECEWSVEVGAPFQPGGHAAWVAPARRDGRDDLVLKVGWRHSEAEHEPDGLKVWAGDGAVMLVDAAVAHDAVVLLVERCVPGTPLMSRPEPDQDRAIALLLQRLWREAPPGHRFRPLQHMCDAWTAAFERKTAVRQLELDPGLVRAAMDLWRTLPATADRQVLLCTDLHAGNVLASEREPWLVIDPKPYVGDPHYDVLQHLLNCDARLSADPHGLTRRMADLAGLDADRLLLWLFARCVQESPDWPAPLIEIAQRIAPD
jgi:streptomycin 6-kinase